MTRYAVRMTTRSLCITVCLGLASGCGSLPSFERPPATPLLATGVGPVAFGSPLAESELLLGEKSFGEDGQGACRYVEFGSLPGLRFTVRDGVVTRADAERGVANALGVDIDDTTDAVLALYPDLRVQRIPESFGGTILVHVAQGGGHAIVMEAAGNKVVAIRAGLLSAVGSSRGCP